MSSREANIGMLNYAIASLNEDAESVHGLINRSIDELENATDAGNKAAENASKIIESLAPMAELMKSRYRDSAEMLGEAKKASDEQRVATAEQVSALKDAVGETLESVSERTETACAKIEKASDEQRVATAEQVNALKDAVGDTLESVSERTEVACAKLEKAVDDSFAEIEEAQTEAFDEIQAKTLKEHERTRDELQTDILAFKNATSARLDVLEAEITKMESTIKGLEGKLDESANSTSKKLSIPIYVAIGFGLVNLICLVMLLMR